jgi:hypothetical protein
VTLDPKKRKTENSDIPVKKKVDVFWMDDDEEIAEFKHHETEEQERSQWQDIQDPNDVLKQLTQGIFGMPGFGEGGPETEEEWKQAFKEFEREMQKMTGRGSFTERATMKAMQRLMVDQQRGGVMGRLSRLFTGILDRVFGVMDRSRMPRQNPKKSKGSKKTKK